MSLTRPSTEVTYYSYSYALLTVKRKLIDKNLKGTERVRYLRSSQKQDLGETVIAIIVREEVIIMVVTAASCNHCDERLPRCLTMPGYNIPLLG